MNIEKDKPIGNISGVNVVLTPKAYEEYRKQLIIEENDILKKQQEEIERLNNIIDKTKENINDEINLLKTGVKGNTKHITISEAISILKIILIQMD